MLELYHITRIMLTPAPSLGAATVLYPLWGGNGVQPGSNLSRILFLLRFYFELPLFAAHSHPASEACRQAQVSTACTEVSPCNNCFFCAVVAQRLFGH